MQFLEKLDKVMDKIERNVVGYATVFLTLIMVVNVVMRNITHTGLVWANELSSYLNILAVYFAISAGFKYGDHVGVDAFVRLLPNKLKDTASIVSHTCSLVFCGIISYLAIRMVIAQANQVSPVLNIPFSILYGIMVIGMIMSAIRIIMEIVKVFKKPEEPSNGGAL